jgi:hypothetical protein
MTMMKTVTRRRPLSPRGWLRRSGTALALTTLIGSAAVAPAGAAPIRAAGQPAVQTLCSTCNGIRYQSLLDPAVYLVIDGLRHHIPDPATYSNLWRTWDGLNRWGDGIDIGEPLLSGSYLAREVETGMVYLVGRSKRWIPDMTVFNEYQFDPQKIVDRRRSQLPGRGPDIPAAA